MSVRDHIVRYTVWLWVSRFPDPTQILFRTSFGMGWWPSWTRWLAAVCDSPRSAGPDALPLSRLGVWVCAVKGLSGAECCTPGFVEGLEPFGITVYGNLSEEYQYVSLVAAVLAIGDRKMRRRLLRSWLGCGNSGNGRQEGRRGQPQ